MEQSGLQTGWGDFGSVCSSPSGRAWQIRVQRHGIGYVCQQETNIAEWGADTSRRWETEKGGRKVYSDRHTEEPCS